MIVKILKVLLGVVILLPLCQPCEAFPESPEDEEICPELLRKLVPTAPQPIPERLFSPASLRIARYHSAIYKRESTDADWESSRLAPGTAPTGEYAEHNTEEFRQLRDQVEGLGGKVILSASFYPLNAFGSIDGIGVFIDVFDDNSPMLVLPPYEHGPTALHQLLVCYSVWGSLRQRLVQRAMPPSEANLVAWAIMQTPFGRSHLRERFDREELGMTDLVGLSNISLLWMGNTVNVNALEEGIVGTWGLEISGLPDELSTQLRQDFQFQIKILVTELIHRTLARRRLLARHYRELAGQHPEAANSDRLQTLLKELQVSTDREGVVTKIADEADPGVRYHAFAAYFALPREQLDVFDFAGPRTSQLSLKALSSYLRGYLESNQTSAN